MQFAFLLRELSCSKSLSVVVKMTTLFNQSQTQNKTHKPSCLQRATQIHAQSAQNEHTVLIYKRTNTTKYDDLTSLQNA